MKFNTIEQEEFVNLVSLNEKEIQKINISRCPLQLSKNKNMRAREEDLQPSCNEKYKGYQKDKRFVPLNRKEIQKIGPLNRIEIQGKKKGKNNCQSCPAKEIRKNCPTKLNRNSKDEKWKRYSKNCSS